MFRIMKKDMLTMLYIFGGIVAIILLYGTITWPFLQKYKADAILLVSASFPLIVLSALNATEQNEAKYNGMHFLCILPITRQQIIWGKLLNLYVLNIFYLIFCMLIFRLLGFNITTHPLAWMHIFLSLALAHVLATVSFWAIRKLGFVKMLKSGIQVAGTVILFIQMIFFMQIHDKLDAAFVDAVTAWHTPVFYVALVSICLICTWILARNAATGEY